MSNFLMVLAVGLMILTVGVVGLVDAGVIGSTALPVKTQQDEGRLALKIVCGEAFFIFGPPSAPNLGHVAAMANYFQLDASCKIETVRVKTGDK